jgi:hypothetical protein
MSALRGTLHLPTCLRGLQRLLTLLVVFTRTEDAEPGGPLWKSIHTTHREDARSRNPLTVGGIALGRWLREGRRGRIELLNARWHNPAGRHRPASCPACGANIGINDRTEYRDGALYHLRCFAHGPL